jgi:putative heme transporter
MTDALFDDTDPPMSPELRARARRRALVRTLKVLATVLVLYFVVLSIPGLRRAASELSKVSPPLLALGLVLELLALFCYSLLTKACLGAVGDHMSSWRLFRIQMSTKALSSLMPGGTAAGSALGYRLLVLSGVPGPDAGFALATSGLGSAVMLNVILWVGLIISIPLRGVNAVYGYAALVGVILMAVAAFIIFGLMEGQGRAERALRWGARKVRLDEDRTGEAVRHISSRLEDLAGDRALMKRVMGWALANWLLDAAALWVFLRAFGGSVPIDGLIVAFGLANILAVIPITPGGLGTVEATLIGSLVGFGLPRATAAVGVVSYRLAQFWFPIVLGGVLYLSLRVGPWSIERRDALERMRDIVADEELAHETFLGFSERYPMRDRTQPTPRPQVPDEGDEPSAQ